MFKTTIKAIEAAVGIAKENDHRDPRYGHLETVETIEEEYETYYLLVDAEGNLSVTVTDNFSDIGQSVAITENEIAAAVGSFQIKLKDATWEALNSERPWDDVLVDLEIV